MRPAPASCERAEQAWKRSGLYGGKWRTNFSHRSTARNEPILSPGYGDWAKRVVAELRGTSPLLEEQFDRAAEDAERSIAVAPSRI